SYGRRHGREEREETGPGPSARRTRMTPNAGSSLSPKPTGNCLEVADAAWLFPLLEGDAGALPADGPPAWRATAAVLDALGMAWAGRGTEPRLSGSRNAWHDAEYRHFYRRARVKRRLGGPQGNLEWQPNGRGTDVLSNAHADVDNWGCS
ncbi:MAG: hypothetical protein ACR2HB_12265, partial [Dehalococcoidia bacterium]